MSVSRPEALEAVMNLTDGAEKVAIGIPTHIAENPDLDLETLKILNAVVIVMPLLCSVTRQSFLKALDAEDAIDKLNEWIAEHEKK